MQINVQPNINTQRCTRCGACVEGCPEDALVMGEEGPVFIQPVRCTYCTICEDLCPTGAIRAPFTISWEFNSSSNKNMR